MFRVNTEGLTANVSCIHSTLCPTTPAVKIPHQPEASLVTCTMVHVAQIHGGGQDFASDVHVVLITLLKEAAPTPPRKGREAGDQERRSFTSLLSREASLLTPGALVRPSLLLLRLTTPRLAQKACSSENSEDEST